jgi:hypothetical protein
MKDVDAQPSRPLPNGGRGPVADRRRSETHLRSGIFMQVQSRPVPSSSAPGSATPATVFAALLARADAGVDAATRATWADPTDPVNQAFWADMERLTSSDRATIAVATGFDVPAPGSGARPVAPMLAFHISMDRQSGVLGAGQDVSADYLRAKMAAHGAGNPVIAEELTRALEHVSGRSIGA